MGLFDLLSDTKDKMDKSAKAREYLRDAKRYVNEGEEIYEKAYSRVFKNAGLLCNLGLN